MQKSDVLAGMTVVFQSGREKTVGRVKSIGPKRALVEIQETRGRHPVGTQFRVDYSIMEPLSEGQTKQEVRINRGGFDTRQIVPGKTQFRFNYADSNPLWRVVRKLSPESYLCVIVNEPVVIEGKTYCSDYAGVEQSFLATQIQAALMWAQSLEGIFQAGENFYATLPEGGIYHCHNGFGEWVRCRVVSTKDGNELMPIALVGKWRQADVAQYNPDGSVHYGHHARNVIEHTSFTPHYSTIWESDGFDRDREEDPTKMEPISLELPPLTPEQQRTADLWKRIGHISEIISEGRDPEKILSQIREILG